MLYRKWNVGNPDKDVAKQLARQLNEKMLLSKVLVSRGIDTLEQVNDLLYENTALPDPFSIQDMDKAVERIHAAIENEESIVIFGDYDVDGITSTALLYTYLESAGAQVFYKLPNRSDDGYGLLPSVVDQIADHEISLIITVDNGTSALEAAEQAKKRGVDIVVTDHHLPPDILPEVAALVNPCRKDDTSSYKKLSGVGVTFMLTAALEGCTPEELLPLFGDLVAIGTVADVMRLTGENRAIVRAGLSVLSETQRPGLTALINECGWSDKPITVENISYGIAPRLNAAGRMDDATNALRLLLAESLEEAEPIVEILQEQNTERQKTEQEIVLAITNQIENDPALQRARVLVVWGDGWHQGIIGIVASRLVDKFAKPSIVISFDGDEGRGSGRSLSGMSLYGAISSCADILTRFGGHELAAGLSIQRSHVEEFRCRINEWAAKEHPVPVVPEIAADASIDMSIVTVDEIKSLDRLSPCGSGNPAPKFYLPNVVIDAVYSIREGKHCRLRIKQGIKMLYAVLFGVGPEQLPYAVGTSVDVLVSLSVYDGKGEPQVSARIIELRPAGLTNLHVEQNAIFESFFAGGELLQEQKNLLLPTREETAAIYRAIRGGKVFNNTDLRVAFSYFGEEITGKTLTALAALEELGLIAANELGTYQTMDVKEKKDLGASALLRRLEV